MDQNEDTFEVVKQIVEQLVKETVKGIYESYESLNVEDVLSKIKVSKFVGKKGCKISAHFSSNAGQIIFFSLKQTGLLKD